MEDHGKPLEWKKKSRHVLGNEHLAKIHGKVTEFCFYIYRISF